MNNNAYDMITVADSISYSTDCKFTKCNNNVLVAGGSGSGKTYSVVLKRIFNTYNDNLIVVTAKDTLYNLTNKILQRRNYNVCKIDFLNPSLSTVYWNPIADAKSWSEITKLATDIVFANPERISKPNDPYWNECSISFAASVIGYLKCTMENPNMTHFIGRINTFRLTTDSNGLIQTNFDKDYEKFERLYGPNHYVIKMWNTFRVCPPKTAQCILSTLFTTLDKIFSEDILVNFTPGNGKSQLDVSKLNDEKTVLFLNTSPFNEYLEHLVNIFYSFIFYKMNNIAVSQGGLSIPLQIIADDFAVSGAVNNFPKYLSIMREAGMSTMILIQDESQLETIYGTNSRSIISNCDTYVFLGTNDRVTAKHISESIECKSVSQILSMPVGKEIVMRRGEKPKIFIDRYPIMEDELYKAAVSDYEQRKYIQTQRRYADKG